MHNETQIRRAVKVLLEKYGALNTSEIKEHLQEVLVFDEDDNKDSLTRPGECLIKQRIGNVVSHQTAQVFLYQEGFQVDKTKSPAMWYTINGKYQEETILSKFEIKNRRNRLKNANKNSYRKVNWDEVNERQTALGIAGEEFVYQNEIDTVKSINPLLVDRVQHLSMFQGDGFGYDILSVDNDGNSKYIEVKTTTSNNPNSPFFLSINEFKFFRENINNGAYIYRVYNFSQSTRSGQIMIISASDLINKYDFDPISFRVIYRG